MTRTITAAQRRKMLEGRKKALQNRQDAKTTRESLVESEPDPKDGVRAEFLRAQNESQRGVFERAYSGRSAAAGIKAKCIDCCCGQRVEVEKCSDVACPLWEYRPYRKKQKGAGR